jgi:hypothetical protein
LSSYRWYTPGYVRQNINGVILRPQLCGGGVNGVGSPSPGRGMQHDSRSEGCGRYFVQADRSLRTIGSRGSLEGFTSIPESNDGEIGTMSSVHMVRVRLLRS